MIGTPRAGIRGPGLILAASVLFGTTGTAQAIGPDASDPLAVGLTRLVLGGFGLVAAAIVLGRLGDFRSASKTSIVAGAVAVLGYQLAFFAGVRVSGVALGTVVTIGSAPILTGLISWLALGERPTRPWLASTALAVVGIVLIAGPTGGAAVHGVVLNLGAGLSYAVFATASKRLLASQPPLGVMAVVFGGGAVLALTMMPVVDMGFLASPSGIAMGVWLGFVTTTAAYVLYGYGLRNTPVGTAATLTLMEPVAASALGVLLLAERPPTTAWQGMALVLIALGVLVGVPARRRRTTAVRDGPTT